MKLYCFLLLIILICLVYDNKLYEGANGQYDTSKDATVGYQSGGLKGEESILDQLGVKDYLPKDFTDQFDGPSNVSGLNCSQYDNKTCNEVGGGIKAHDNNFKFGSGDGGDHNSSKRKCMDCLKCKDNYAFVDEFYGRLCDTIAACYDHPVDYIEDTMPYAFAYGNTDWGRACSNPALLNPLQKTTCKLLNDNGLIDKLMWVKKPETAKCHAEIAALQTPGVGMLAHALL